MSNNAELEAKIVDAIYRGACDVAELNRALEMMTAYFHSPGAALGEVDQARPECQMGLASGNIVAQTTERYSQYAYLDPLPHAFAALAVGTVTTSNRVVPQSELPSRRPHGTTLCGSLRSL
jgi:hypothetical protein